MKKHSVVIVDDHTLLSQAIGALVNSFENFETSYLCKNGQELLTKCKNPDHVPDIVLMDVNMPILNGIETTEILKVTHPELHVLALSVEADEVTILKMLRAGAKGYLLKDTQKDILEKALIQVVNEGFYHTNEVTQLLIGSLHKKDNKISLKDREVQFLKHACTEMTYKEIAEKMFVSPKTVEGYRDAVYEKLEIKNRIGLVLYAIKAGYFKP